MSENTNPNGPASTPTTPTTASPASKRTVGESKRKMEGAGKSTPGANAAAGADPKLKLAVAAIIEELMDEGEIEFDVDDAEIRKELAALTARVAALEKKLASK